jgi:hypothetical protein
VAARAEILREVLGGNLTPAEGGNLYFDRSILTMYLGNATMRLAISLERTEGDALVDTFKRMTLRELLAE